MKALLQGYSGYGSVGDYGLLMTSFSLTMTENIIESSGIANLLKTESADEDSDEEEKEYFRRYRLNAVRDYPGYEISISSEVMSDFLEFIIEKISTSSSVFLDVEFHDDANNITYEFEECCLTSFQLNVGNNQAATVNMQFTTYKDTIDVSFGNYDYSKKNNARNGIVGNVLIAYWAWKATYSDFKSDDLLEFNLSYSQSVTPKYGCYGETSKNNAQGPKKLIFGLPTLTYDLTYLVYSKTKLKSYEKNSNAIAKSGNTLGITCAYSVTTTTENEDDEEEETTEYKEFKFNLTDCYANSYSANYANGNDANKISISGTCYGSMSVEKEEDEGE